MQKATGSLETVPVWCDCLIPVPQDLTQHQGLLSHHHPQPATLATAPCSKAKVAFPLSEGTLGTKSSPKP